MNIPPIVALEIGTTKVRTVIGEPQEDGHLMITGLGECPSRGVRKGEIADFDNALACVKSSLNLAEESGNVFIQQVHLLVTGGHIQGLVNTGSVPMMGSSGEIHREDIEHVIETSRAINLPPDREILHTIYQHFHVDDQEGVINPEGMEGTKLAVDMLILHGVRNRLANSVKIVRTAQMEVQDVAFSGLCSALAVLSPEEKDGGVVLIDLGGGTTDYVMYTGSAIYAAGSIAVGGDHITNDIARGLRMPIHQAERLKEESGSALLDNSMKGQRVTFRDESGMAERYIRLDSLNTIIQLRMEEILNMVNDQLNPKGLPNQLGMGIVLTGGGAYLNNVWKLAEQIFGLPCYLGEPRDVSGLATVTKGPGYAAPIGLIRYGVKSTMKDHPGWSIKSLFKSLFKV